VRDTLHVPMRLVLHRLRNDPALRRIVSAVAVIVVVSIVLGIATDLVLARRGSLVERAERLAARGDFAGADRLYREALQSGPVEVPTLVALIDNRVALARAVLADAMSGRSGGGLPVVSTGEVSRILGRVDVPPDVATLGRFWAAVQLGLGRPDADAVRALADRAPPVRHANRLLARAALRNDDFAEAAARLEREGLAFEEGRDGNLRHALALWIELEAWAEIRARIDDPAWSGAVGAFTRRALAEHERDWTAWLFWLWPASFAGAKPWPIVLAVVAGCLWFAIAASLGGAAGHPGRLGLYALAFVLGMISIYPTLVVITIEETLFDLRFTGEPVADAIYFVFGVGLREELCKFLLFLPLLPILRRRGSRIEALVCGAMVGLGFAAEENVNYFHRMEASVALGRFLTANFLHMALTGLVALAAWDSGRPRRPDSFDLNTTFLLAVFIHGAYDFFLASPVVGDYSIFAMTVFVLLSQRFLREVLASNATPPESALRLFLVSITILTGVSYVFASTLAGPWTAFQLIAVGLVGQAILIYMFVMELGRR
jgi:protease PrsW